MRTQTQIIDEINRLKKNLYFANSTKDTKGAVAWLNGAIEKLEWVLKR